MRNGGQRMHRMLPRSCREGVRYFSQGVKEKYPGAMRDICPRSDDFQDYVVLASPLMVTGTTTGNLRECFVKRPRQTSMYNRYGPWHCHDSAPLMGPY